ncbi:hypothetical protein [Halomicrobium urmianum]|uniref:hypothetical protein n=1 Tax=Halomicrobium urmianum TaxID=1586233 RepID=UPI001CDA4BCB|nr:hypothetical protein [Halomicrobium urmianum]
MVLVGLALTAGGAVAAVSGFFYQLRECSVLLGPNGGCPEPSIVSALALLLLAVGIPLIGIGLRTVFLYR